MRKTNSDSAAPRIHQHVELADIFRLYADNYRHSYAVSYQQLKVMRHIQICRTAVLGGHVEQCDQCAFEQIAYNSCRDRHCPKCQTLTKEQWLNDRNAELLGCGYFHLVFTLPHDLNPIILSNKRATVNILFAAVNQTLQAFAKDPQWRLEGRLGFISVLHTWSQTLIAHFHLHCLIPAGALSFTKDRWIAYAKRPLAGPQQVLEYFGRYTHRVAISNNRIICIDIGRVTFTYRDRQRDNEMMLRLTGIDITLGLK
ncbi:MAG: transposase zinc-binding domain-containing protein [Deltaproteobacteria bacterium]|nr:transposase zinc-binding domain-containing protein [Deltaproteobacteria bacterium]